MPIVLNTNASATEATFNLSKANDSLRLAPSPGFHPATGSPSRLMMQEVWLLHTSYSLQLSVQKLPLIIIKMHYLTCKCKMECSKAIGDIVDRMSELRTMAADVSKNAADVENYSKEFLELQDQLQQMKREKFNGVELFVQDDETLQGVNTTHLTTTSDTLYEYFDDPTQSARTETGYDKYEYQLYTHPSGKADDGSVKLNIVNLEFLLGLKEPNASFGLTDPAAGNAAATTATNPYIASDDTINLAGLDQPALTGATNIAKLTNNTGTGFIRDITDVSIEEFTNVIEKIADARAENGAEQQRVNQSLKLQQNNLVNLEAAHGRIMDVDVALESSRLARHSVKVQASAAMVAQANQMSAVALSLLQ